MKSSALSLLQTCQPSRDASVKAISALALGDDQIFGGAWNSVGKDGDESGTDRDIFYLG